MEQNEFSIQISEKTLDLEKIIATKNPGLLKAMPGFVIRYIKKIIHQDSINSALWRHKDLTGVDFIGAMLPEFGANIHVTGLEYLQKTDRWIIASNHPLGGLDGMALMKVAGEVRPNILFPVNDLLMYLPNIRNLFIPVNKHGSNSENAELIDNTFAGDHAILYFPAGLCSRKQHGNICDLEWKKTFITKAKRHKRDIIPTHISGRNSNWFYNLANFRKRLGIKANIEMFYLVDEMYKQKNQNIDIIFGAPIPYTTFDKRFSDRNWSELVKKHVYELENNPDAHFAF